MEKSSRLQEFEQFCDEVDRQFGEIQYGLISNFERVEKRADKLRQAVSSRGEAFQNVEEREERLKKYAEFLMEQSKLIKSGSERLKKYTESLNQHLSSETNEKLKQLELLEERQKMLAEVRRYLAQ